MKVSLQYNYNNLLDKLQYKKYINCISNVYSKYITNISKMYHYYILLKIKVKFTICHIFIKKEQPILALLNYILTCFFVYCKMQILSNFVELFFLTYINFAVNIYLVLMTPFVFNTFDSIIRVFFYTKKEVITFVTTFYFICIPPIEFPMLPA